MPRRKEQVAVLSPSWVVFCKCNPSFSQTNPNLQLNKNKLILTFDKTKKCNILIPSLKKDVSSILFWGLLMAVVSKMYRREEGAEFGLPLWSAVISTSIRELASTTSSIYPILVGTSVLGLSSPAQPARKELWPTSKTNAPSSSKNKSLVYHFLNIILNINIPPA